MMEPIDQARRYFKGVPSAISGQNGHAQAFSAMSSLVHGFSLSDTDALTVFGEYNQTCQPPWSEREIAHKLSESKAKPPSKPRGWLLSAHNRDMASPRRGPHSHSPRPQSVAPVPRAKQYGTVKAELPPPMADGVRAYLKAMYRPGEGVRMILADLGEDGKEVPNAGATLKLEDWLKKLDAKGGNINKILKSADRCGIYVGINPLKLGKTGHDENVTAYRHVLIEFDEIPVEEQYGLIIASKIPCTAIVASGGKSIHALVKVDARDRDEYAERADIYIRHFESYRVDVKNRNPARISRLPGCERFSRRQELLALNIGLPSFDEWMDSVNKVNNLPEIIDAFDFVQRNTPAPEQIIKGILHRGMKLGLGGGSKSFKSWTLLDLALSVAHGQPWLSFPTTQGKVVFVNFEIPDFAWEQRIKAVAAARNIEVQKDVFMLWNLRGFAANHVTLMPQMIDSLKHQKIALIVIDPTYKMYGPGTDENSASDMNELMNSFEQFCVQSKAAMAFGAHFSKGNQSSKSSIDRISGSGVFARDPDALIMLTPHEEDAHFVIEPTLRLFAPVEPFVVKWEWSFMRGDTGLDPKKLKQPKAGNKRSFSNEQLLEAIKDTTDENTISTVEWSKKLGISRSTLDFYLNELRRKNFVLTIGEGSKSRKCISIEGLNYLQKTTPKPAQKDDEIEPF